LSETSGYENVKCQVRVSPKCRKTEAGYQRREQYAQQGPWMDACEECARVPYEQPAQFQKEEEDPANVAF
jgi:hypothetical protein